MSTKAVIKAWYSIGNQYIYWNTSQISDPLSEYPTGSPGYPAAALLSDFVLLDYDGVTADNFSDGVILNIAWGVGVTDGYAVYMNDNAGTPEVLLGNAASFATSRIIGVAYVESDKVVTEGEYEVYCDGTATTNDPVYLSSTIPGAVTTTAPRTIMETQIKIGTCSENKLTGDVDKVKVYIDPDEPMEIQDTIEI
jgi:hypothetical protein